MKLVFYTTPSGRAPVETEIEKLNRNSKAKVSALLSLLAEYGEALREPHVKSLGDGLKELRISIVPGQYRVIYFVETQERIVLLHSFAKKTQKTPKKNWILQKNGVRTGLGG